MKTTVSQRMRAGLGRAFPCPWLIGPGLGLIMSFLLEVFSRRSLALAFGFVFQSPLLFLLNWAVVSFTFYIALLFRRKIFSLTLASVIWLVFGVVNCVLLSRRTGSPLSAADLELNMDAILMIPIYYTWWFVALMVLLGAAVVYGLVMLCVKTPRYRKELGRGFLRLGFGAAVLAGLIVYLGMHGCLPRTLKPSLYHAYRDYGFAYSFVYSFFDTGMEQPEAYSGEIVQNIGGGLDLDVETSSAPKAQYDSDAIDTFRQFISGEKFSSEPEGYTAEAVELIGELIGAGNESSAAEDVPNIVFVQLEAFFDPSVLTEYEYEGDPIENFRKLCRVYPSGRLSVPTVSGGTANTEFEVLTGCNLDFFGSGEFPFYSVLHDNVCESLATDLKSSGLTATFLHTYSGSFYYRNRVYSNLCFDRFVSVEYMNGYEETPKGWCKDEILVDYITKALTTTPGRDFVFAVTVQTHGAYPVLEDFESAYTVTKAPDEEQRLVMGYYLTQLGETDKFIGDLTRTLAYYDEPTVVVFYGDHLPGLDFDVEDLTTGELYSTRYVIWANFPIDKTDRDVEAYQLGALVLGKAGIDSGVMIKLHQTEAGTEKYLADMQTLEYDMMYGSRYIYGGAELSRSGEMQYGLEPIVITDMFERDGNLFVNGENFTRASAICVSGKDISTIFVSPDLLIAPDTALDPEDTLSVAQIAADGVVLSETVYENAGE